MIENFRKYGFAIIVAVIFTAFVSSLADVVMEKPDYSEYCVSKPAKALLAAEKRSQCPETEFDEADQLACARRGGRIDYEYDREGCLTGYACNECSIGFEAARKDYELYVFLFAAVLGVIAAVFGVFYPAGNIFWEWVTSGFLLGGIFTLFIGTVRYFRYLGRFTKPLVMLAELAFVLFIAYMLLRKKKPRR